MSAAFTGRPMYILPPPDPDLRRLAMKLSELNMSSLTLDQSNRILELAEDIAEEINDPKVEFSDVARMFCEDVAEIDRWNAPDWDVDVP